MIFHYPSFLHYFEVMLPIEFVFFHHNGIVRLYTENPYIRLAALQELVADVVERSLDDPLGAPTGPRQRSLLDAPIDTHCDALRQALLERSTYLRKVSDSVSGGEEKDLVEYRIDLKEVQRILIEVRDTEDVTLAERLLHGEVFMSDRLLEKKILHTVGVAFSNRRCRRIMKILLKQKKLKYNGRLRTHGREVLI